MLNPPLDDEICQKARMSRDPRFDGKFFTAVRTTGIYCRTICPVFPPKEENVSYFSTAIAAATAGYRPCLRCRPDSAPGSPAWKGVSTTLERAIKLIDEGALQEGNLQALSERLGISDRYLRDVFKKHLGTSPKTYALYQQCLFAKQLLHQTKLPITQVALASGFSSIRRFNDCFVSQLNLTPSQMRKSSATQSNSLQLKLYYRPPYDSSFILNFYSTRRINKLEWGDQNSYGRTFEWLGTVGSFTAKHIRDKNRFDVSVELSDVKQLKPIINNIRRLLDLDVDMSLVEYDLQQNFKDQFPIKSGIRLPGIWSMFEAGIRAILGQQISVVAARNLVTTLVETLGQSIGENTLFPTPKSINESDLSFLKIPNSRKQTLKNLASHYLEHFNPNDAEQWLKLKGIGPWTINYAKMRGLSDPDIFLGGDLGIKKAIGNADYNFLPEQASPWRSYLTFQLWSQL
ncbi:DNA-3-methyladenine glycosylase 2 family protein [Pseudoalteromonas denitrificans]|uniref:DNA-3-methyladenine glycosylase II n=1 Tax=Pseudoalteromonas denitrificans DSM 6059 TaxID=1123010 RepID=A0A1I1N308_9GAMM|nr:AlkA N-terminal domain-containing protein [Pseudoalteromonas denitrificans]SFC89868.1 DNA-3-methyladenine glycosylase II [Pseudoalteromonas denitrificans DSM 6059]